MASESYPNLEANTTREDHTLTNKTFSFPQPLIIYPQSQHRQTFIILHGRGSFAAKFGPPLLSLATSTGETLQSAFPHAKIVFPTAARNRATIYKRSYTHQWFDNWHLEQYQRRQDLQVNGLHASCTYIHSLLHEEIQTVGRENVVLWGLSQGCATSLTSLLTWDGEPFAAVVGMCGWLPFGNVIEELARERSDESDDHLFGYASDSDRSDLVAGMKVDAAELRGSVSSSTNQLASPVESAVEAVKYVREEIGMDDKQGNVYQKIPVFLGHGTEDDSVVVGLGREAKRYLTMLGTDTEMVEYQGLGHWYSASMLEDIFLFLRSKLIEVPGQGALQH